MEFLDEVMGKIKTLEEEAAKRQAEKRNYTEIIFSDAKAKLIEKITPEALATGKVVHSDVYQTGLGDNDIDVQYLNELCAQNCIAWDWSNPTPSGRKITFRLDLEAVQLKKGPKLELKNQ